MSEKTEGEARFKHASWGRQIDAIAHELSELAIACDIELGRPGLAERILKNDKSVCGRDDPKVFQQLRQHLMALFTLEKRAIEQLGAEDTRDILDQVRASIIALRRAGSAGHSVLSDCRFSGSQPACGCTSTVEHWLPKLRMRVRFPSLAPGLVQLASRFGLCTIAGKANGAQVDGYSRGSGVWIQLRAASGCTSLCFERWGRAVCFLQGP